MRVAVLDTGSFSALSPATERGRARLRALRERVEDLAVPAVVLSEGLLSGHPGRDYHVQRLLTFVAIEPVDEDLGHAAGRLRTMARRGGADPAPSGVDATVVALADARSAIDDVVIITSDPDDLRTLVVHAEHRRRIQVQPV